MKNIVENSNRSVFRISLLKLSRILVPTLLIIMLFIGGAIINSSPAVAYMTLQINPSLEFAIDEDNRIISVNALNDDAKLLIKELSVNGKEIDDALILVVGKANELGFIRDEREFMLTFRSVNSEISDSNEEHLNELAEVSKTTLRTALSEVNLNNIVRTAVISDELFKISQELGYLPSEYFDLVEENVSHDKIVELIKLFEIQGIAPEIYFEEFHTVSSAAIDLLEAGIDENDVVSMIAAILSVDKSVEEFSTIVASMIDIHDAGGDFKQVINLIKSATEANVSAEIILEEITTLTAAYIDMIDEGISESAAFTLLTYTMGSDTSLEEITTVTAAYIDLIEFGLSESHAANIIKEAIMADPTLDSFDDFIESVLDVEDSDDDAEIDEDEDSDDTADIDVNEDQSAM